MIRLLALLALAAGPVLADPAPAAKPAEAKANAEPKPACKKTVVGRGLDRHVVCTFEVPVVVKAGTPKPKVLMVHSDGKSVVGRPRSGDRLEGLSHQLD